MNISANLELSNYRNYNNYLDSLTRDPLAKLQACGLDFAHPAAQISCGPVVGNFLQLLTKIQQPRRILELGTMLGYSALCMAVAMPKTARLVSIEKQQEHWARAVANCERAGFSPELLSIKHIQAGDFLQSAEFRRETWDLVFVDADKLGYSQYYAGLLEHLPTGALIIFDNVLFRGEVCATEPGKIARAMQAFNLMVSADSRVQSSLVPIRDGLLLIRKK